MIIPAMRAGPPLPGAVRPGCWGVAHGSGWLGTQIRRAQENMSVSARFPAGDHEASWAGHAFMAVGEHPLSVGAIPEPCIVEAEWPKVRLSPAHAHADAIWATEQPLTPEQRAAVVAAALGMLGQHYDPMVYLWFLVKAAGMTVTGNLGPLFADPRIRICSGVVAAAERRGGVNTTRLRLAATTDPNVIAPADLLRWGLDAGWMNREVPPW